MKVIYDAAHDVLYINDIEPDGLASVFNDEEVFVFRDPQGRITGMAIHAVTYRTVPE